MAVNVLGAAGLALMAAASFCIAQQRKRYSGQQVPGS